MIHFLGETVIVMLLIVVIIFLLAIIKSAITALIKNKATKKQRLERCHNLLFLDSNVFIITQANSKDH